jgi:hypothetical protein
MNNRELSRQLQILRSLFDKTQDFIDRDMEIEIISHWAKYLCVLSAGFLENSLTEIYVDFSSRAASPHVANFARESLLRIYNPKSDRFIKVTNSFDKSWGDNLTAFFEENGRKEAVNAIMTHRHKIAHGKDSDISFHRLRDYLNKAVEVVEFIEKQCC